jgi:competence protein ComEC
MLYPLRDQPYRGNDASCVLRVEASGRSVLLPGDIERRSEALLAQGNAGRLAADILVAPHHGSATSSTAAFLQAVHPAYVLFPVGYLNRYGFPRKGVVARYAAEGARRLDTDREGAISFRLGRGPLQPASYRRVARRYWNDR